jgi:uncharacterized protein (DUF362 family)
MERITKRSFVKRVIGWIGSITIIKSLNSTSLAQQLEDKSKVVIVKHNEATDNVRNINAENVLFMMDEAIKQLTGIATVSDAWLSLLPNYKKEHVIAIKVNPIGGYVFTHPDVVKAIVSGLTSAGVPENNIIIYDRTSAELNSGGFQYNIGDTGVRCFGTDEAGWGYDWDNPFQIMGQNRAISKIVARCDHLINVPVLKVHLEQYGVTLSLKNHYGSVDSPSSLHGNFPESCATLNSHEAIKNKTRLVVIDGLFGCWGSVQTTWVIDCAPNSLIISKDPVAADYIGTDMLNQERAKRGLPPRNVPLLEKASQMGLGTNDPEKMDLIKMEFGEPGKSIDPKGSYKTQQGKIKRY